jgi:ACS family glucarate transporter-like MFS transporter
VSSAAAAGRPTAVRHWVLAALLVITSINYLQRNAIAPAAPRIEKELALGLGEIDLVLGAFFLSYTLMQVPSGVVAQHLGAKWALVLFAAGWSLAIAGTGLARNFVELYAGRVVMGALQAGIFPSATLILQVWYPASRRGLASALLNSFMLLGGVLSAFVAGALLEPLGWRGLFVVFAMPGLVWAVWFAWWFRRSPGAHPGVNSAELAIIHGGTTPAPSRSRLVTTTTSRDREGAEATAHKPGVADVLAVGLTTVLLVCTQQAFRAAANRLVDTLMPTYYQKARGLSEQWAAYLTGALLLVAVVGGLAGGVLSDEVLRRTGSRRAARNGVAVFSLIGSVLLYLLAFPIADVYLATVVFGFGVLLFSFSSPCAYALSMDIGGKYLAIVFSLMNMAGNLGAFAFLSLAGWLERLGGWDLVLAVFAGMHVVAAVCWALLDPEIVIGQPSLSSSAE